VRELAYLVAVKMCRHCHCPVLYIDVLTRRSPLNDRETTQRDMVLPDLAFTEIWRRWCTVDILSTESTRIVLRECHQPL